MKASCKLSHTFISGWKSYDVLLTTDFSGGKTFKVKEYSIMMKDEYTPSDFYSWAQSNGIDAKALFVDKNLVFKDKIMVDNLIKLIDEQIEKNNNEMCNNKCYTKISAKRNKRFPPMETAFETFFWYDVLVQLEYNSMEGHITIPAPGREKNDHMTFIMGSGPNMGKQLYEEKEAINYVESQIYKLVNDCDSEEKLNQLLKKLNKIQSEAIKALKG